MENEEIAIEEARQRHLELMMVSIEERWKEVLTAYSQADFKGLSKPFTPLPVEDMPKWKRWV